MKKLIVAFLFCLTSLIANAEGFVLNKPVICVDLQSLLKSLTETHIELPIMLGKDSSDSSKYSLFINQKTGTWTFIQFDDDVACIIGVGTSAVLKLGQKL